MLDPITQACWDAVHMVECKIKGGSKAEYRVSSTVILSLKSNLLDLKSGSMQTGGQCGKVTDQNLQLPADFGTKVDPDMFHIKVIGRIIEANESALRNDIIENYVNK
jgi:hypothetical protein